MSKDLSARTKWLLGIALLVVFVIIGIGAWAVVSGKFGIRADSGAISGKVYSSSACKTAGVTVWLKNAIYPSNNPHSTVTDAYGNFSFAGASYNTNYWLYANTGCKTGWGTCKGYSDDFRLTASAPTVKKNILLRGSKYALRVSVSSSQGYTAISNATVKLTFAGITQYTGTSGYTTFGSIDPEPVDTEDFVNIQVSKNGFGTQERSADLGACVLNGKGFTLTKQ